MTGSLEQALGYTFRDRPRLQQALTHRSLGDASNERLEFLGDRVLALVIAEKLLAMHDTEAEGEIARRHAALVSAPTLQAIATHLAIAQFLRSMPRGAITNTMLGDAVEALIGAVFCDGGMAAASAVVQRLWAPYFAAPLATAPKDAKSQLQEWLQSRGLPRPDYSIVTRSGTDHEPVFVMAATLHDGRTAQGTGSTKKEAEHAAALTLLGLLQDNA